MRARVHTHTHTHTGDKEAINCKHRCPTVVKIVRVYGRRVPCSGVRLSDLRLMVEALGFMLGVWVSGFGERSASNSCKADDSVVPIPTHTHTHTHIHDTPAKPTTHTHTHIHDTPAKPTTVSCPYPHIQTHIHDTPAKPTTVPCPYPHTHTHTHTHTTRLQSRRQMPCP